jgi:hypothetical protein
MMVEDEEAGTDERQTEQIVPLPSEETLKELSTKLQQLAIHLKTHVQEVMDFIWLFMELHLPKVMMLAIMLLSVSDVCAVHAFFLLLAVVAVSFGSKINTLLLFYQFWCSYRHC